MENEILTQLKTLAKNKDLFGLCTTLKENNFNCKINEVFDGMFIKFDKPIYKNYNVICNNKMGDSEAIPLNDNLVLEIL
jgi:hypothetical protein